MITGDAQTTDQIVTFHDNEPDPTEVCFHLDDPEVPVASEDQNSDKSGLKAVLECHNSPLNLSPASCRKNKVMESSQITSFSPSEVKGNRPKSRIESKNSQKEDEQYQIAHSVLNDHDLQNFLNAPEIIRDEFCRLDKEKKACLDEMSRKTQSGVDRNYISIDRYFSSEIEGGDQTFSRFWKEEIKNHPTFANTVKELKELRAALTDMNALKKYEEELIQSRARHCCIL